VYSIYYCFLDQVAGVRVLNVPLVLRDQPVVVGIASGDFLSSFSRIASSFVLRPDHNASTPE
jgi:hypothetical protein